MPGRDARLRVRIRSDQRHGDSRRRQSQRAFRERAQGEILPRQRPAERGKCEFSSLRQSRERGTDTRRFHEIPRNLGRRIRMA